MRHLHTAFVAVAFLGCGSGSTDKDKSSSAAPEKAAAPKSAGPGKSGGPLASGSSAKAALPNTAPSAASSAAAADAPMPTKFVRERVSMAEKGLDACTYLGGLGFACLNALLEEKDPIIKRYMRRLSDADARLSSESFQKGEPNGVAHPEIAMVCAESGPCKQSDASGTVQDDGYACLTKAQALAYDKDPKSADVHRRACDCDLERAQIPVTGGFLACDAKDKPTTRGTELSVEEAKEIRACGECEPEAGPKACEKEVERLGAKDAELARFIRQVHAPRCAQP